MTRSTYRTWSASRASPLRLDYYPADHPVHVTIRTYRRRPVFTSTPLAGTVFRVVRSHERTLGAVLMPDHLHWLLDCADKAPPAVTAFKSLTTRLAWRHGQRGRLWQRSWFDHVIRDSEGIGETLRYLLANPIRAGLASEPAEYPWCYDRFDLAGGR